MQQDEIKAAFSRLKKRISKRGECWIWQGAIDTNGYGCIRVGDKVISTHRLAYLAVHGPIPRGKVVRHSCDVTDCCCPKHVLCGDHEDNVQDQRDRNRFKPRRVLTDAERATVAEMRHAGSTKRQIAEALHINWNAVSRALDDLGIGRGKGGRPKGSRNARQRFSEDQKRRIAEEYAAGGITQKALAEKHGCDQTYISILVRR